MKRDRQRYEHPVVAVLAVTDGDTYRFAIDPGFHLTITEIVRLNGYDCPEKSSRAGQRYTSAKERAAAIQARQMASTFLTTSKHLWVRTYKDPENFGRWLGDVWDETPEAELDLGEALASAQLATVWPERWHEVYDR